MRKSRWIGFGVALLLVGAAFSMALAHGVTQGSTNVAYAQAAATATPSAPTQPAPPGQNAWSDITTAFWNALASKLGLTVDNLKTDVVDAQKAAIEQAVQDGKLTRAQADQLEQHLSTNTPAAPFLGGFGGGPGRGPGNGPHGGPLGGVDTLEAEAQALNLKPADLAAQLKSGKTLADIAKSQNVDPTKVKQAIIDSAKAQIQRQVQDGLLTQAQATQILSGLTLDRIDLSRTPGLGGLGPGPWGGPGPGQPGGTNTP